MASRATFASLPTIESLLSAIPRLRAANPDGLKIGYARVSTDDQHPEVQVDRLYDDGCHVVFVDLGVSGRKTSRPQWDALYALLAKGDTLEAVRLDRIGRSSVHLGQVAKHLQAIGADLRMLDQAVDTTSAMGVFVYTMLGAMAQFELDLILERTRDGQVSVRRAGNLRRSFGGLPPFGFGDTSKDRSDDRDWEVDQPIAEVLSDGARLVLDDPEHNVSAAYQVVKGRLDKAAGGPVSERVFRDALARPASGGLIAEPVKEEDRKDGDPPYRIVGPAKCGGPLDEDTWRELSSVFNARRTGPTVKADHYPVGPALRCYRCGNQLSGTKVKQKNRRGEVTGEPYRWYGCRSPRVVTLDDGTTETVKACGGVSVSATDLHELIGVAVDEWSQTDAARAAAARRPQVGTRRAELTDLRSTYVKRMDTMTARLNARRMSERAFADQETYLNERFDAIDAELGALMAEADTLLPAIDPWETLAGPDRLKAVYLALQTPIVVGPPVKGRRGSASERVTLEFRDPSR